jgi:hypothetical protein
LASTEVRHRAPPPRAKILSIPVPSLSITSSLLPRLQKPSRSRARTLFPPALSSVRARRSWTRRTAAQHKTHAHEKKVLCIY